MPKSRAASKKSKMQKLRIQLRAVFYKEDDLWFAHCLEMDVMGHGSDKIKAFQMLNGAIDEQIRMSLGNHNPANIFQPADGRFFAMYAAGTDSIQGVCEVPIKVVAQRKAENVEIQNVEAREFQGQLALC